MPKRRSTAELLESADSVGLAIQQQDRAVEARHELEQATPALLPFSKILDRTQNTRELRPQHVTELVESIAVLGLLEPLVVDCRGRLLAGGHRKAAIIVLQETDPSAYGKHFPDDLVPVRMMSFDAESDPDLALQVEVSENEKRRDYTPSEVRSLAERLKQAGYVEVKGRPTKGKKPLRPALEVIIGKSIRTVRRYLNVTPETPGKSVTDDRLSESPESTVPLASLRRLRSELVRWQKGSTSRETIPELETIDRDVERLLKRVNTMLQKWEN